MKNILTGLYFTIILVCGYLILDDYGVHTDATLQIIRGGINAKYILGKCIDKPEEKFPELSSLPDLQEYKDKDHGPFFEILTVGLAKLLNISVSRHDAGRELILLRHGILFLIFVISLIAFYRFLFIRTGNKLLSILGPTFLLLSPRFFANSFYNSKDILFLSLSLITLYFLVSYSRKKNLKNLILASCLSGLAASTRIIGFIFPVLLFINVIMDLSISGQFKTFIKSGSYLKDLAYFFLFFVFLILFFPTLWEDPARNLFSIFANMSDYDKLSFSNLYFGKYLDAENLPWHYLPVWIGLTTPLILIFLFITGLVFSVRKLIKPPHISSGTDLMLFLFFIFPFLYIILTRPVLYDGWRHMYFLYISILYFSVLAIYHFLSSAVKIPLTVRRFLVIIILFIGFIRPVYFSIKFHPFQYVYFNILLPSERLENEFDKDWWGLSYKQGLEYILQKDHSDTIRVSTRLHLADFRNPNYFILKETDKKRLIFVDKHDDPDYYLTEYRNDTLYADRWKPVHQIIVGDINILGIYRPDRGQ